MQMDGRRFPGRKRPRGGGDSAKRRAERDGWMRVLVLVSFSLILLLCCCCLSLVFLLLLLRFARACAAPARAVSFSARLFRHVTVTSSCRASYSIVVLVSHICSLVQGMHTYILTYPGVVQTEYTQACRHGRLLRSHEGKGVYDVFFVVRVCALRSPNGHGAIVFA